LEQLQQHKLFLKPEKCNFEKRKIEYLGIIILEGQVEMDPVKVAGVVDWPTPTTKKELQQFLGFTNFYRHFILDYSHIAQPLFILTGKTDFKWGEDDRVTCRTQTQKAEKVHKQHKMQKCMNADWTRKS
jgi:hypothetical protein